MLLGMIFVAAIMSCVRRKSCCTTEMPKYVDKSLEEEELSLVAEEFLVKEVLRERAKDKWTRKFDDQTTGTRAAPAADDQVNQCVVCVELHMSFRGLSVSVVR